MQNSVFSRQLVESIVDELKITDLAQATIGQVVLLASALEQRTGIPFIRVELIQFRISKLLGVFSCLILIKKELF